MISVTVCLPTYHISQCERLTHYPFTAQDCGGERDMQFLIYMNRPTDCLHLIWGHELLADLSMCRRNKPDKPRNQVILIEDIKKHITSCDNEVQHRTMCTSSLFPVLDTD